jgi:hypothetical protein
MTETVAAEGTVKRRGVSPLLITGVLAVIAAVLAGGVVVLQHYQPLHPGESGLDPPGKTVASDDPTEERPTIQVTYVDGQTMRFGFSIWNTGRWGVTVTGVGREDSGGLINHFVFHLASETFIDDLGPFHPFALQPGKQQSILVTATFANCENYSFSTSSIYETIAIQYKTLDIVHSTEVPLKALIAVVSPSDANCPRARPSA